MSDNYHVPADARARRQMLAAQQQKNAEKTVRGHQTPPQATHLKVPPVHGNRGNRSQEG